MFAPLDKLKYYALDFLLISIHYTILLSTMFSFSKFIYFCFLIFLVKPIVCQQSNEYDTSNCTSQSPAHLSNSTCSPKMSCSTYIVYRAQKNFNTFSSVSSLFNLSQWDLLSVNNLREDDPSTNLSLGQEIIVPVTCNCTGQVCQVIFKYNFSSLDSFAAVSCGVFEGLVKAQSLVEENPGVEGYDPDNSLINIPIRCACPDTSQRSNGVNYLVTYPVIEKDHTDLIASKFGVPESAIWDANKIGPHATIFPLTTLLIPVKDDLPVVNWGISSFPENSPGPIAVIALENFGAESSSWNSHVFLGVGIFVAVGIMVLICSSFIRIQRKHHPRSFHSLSSRNSVLSNASPDFLDGLSKLKRLLISYSSDELKVATDNFDKDSMLSRAVYRGRIGGSYLAIKKMDSEETTRNITYILTKINHINIVKLEGICPGDNPYLVFEFAENGSLRDCLSNPELDRQFTWGRRMQIAFDLAEALHYLHYCTTPAFVHQNINSRNVLITTDWRAKISGFKLAKPVIYTNQKEDINWNEAVTADTGLFLSPKYLTNNGQTSFKEDVFAFGVVLLELISAKELTREGKILEDLVNLLADGGLEGSALCLEKLKEFMDPDLEGEYPLDDASCLALLAKVCIEADPCQRPTMNDIWKALSKFV